MTNTISARLGVSASKIRKVTSKATSQITKVFSKKSESNPVSKLQISDPVPGTFVHLLHIPAHPAGSVRGPLVPDDLLVVDAVVVDDTPTSNEELQKCRRKLHKTRSDLAWLVTATAGLLKLQIQRSTDLAATNRAMRQELMELKTTWNTARSKTRQQLIDEVARLTAQLDRAADEISQLRE